MKDVFVMLIPLTYSGVNLSAEGIVYAVILVEMFLSWVYYELTDRRDLSMASPLLAGYLALNLGQVYALVLAFIISSLVIELAYWRFLFYGMRSLYLAMLVSSITCLLTMGSSLTVLLVSTLPGLLSYDVHTSMYRARTALASWGLTLITAFTLGAVIG